MKHSLPIHSILIAIWLAIPLAAFAQVITSSRSVAAVEPKVQTASLSFEISGQKYSGHQVLPVGGHHLNQLALELQNEIVGIKVVVSDELLSHSSAKGAFAFRQNILFISRSAEAAASIDPVIKHEVTHARIWNALREGRPCAFSGIATNGSSAFAFRPYGSAFGIDEVVATIFSVNFHVDEMKLRLGRAKTSTALNAFSDVRESLDQVRSYTARLVTMLTTLHEGIAKGKSSKVANTPPELSFLPKPIEWQKIETADIKILLPLRSEQELARLSDFSKYAVDALQDGDRDAEAVQLLQETADQIVRIETFDRKTRDFIQEFNRQFPEDSKLLAL